MRSALVFFFLPALAAAQDLSPVKPLASDSPPPIYSFAMKRIDGTMQRLSEYRGKVLLLVNVASKCGLTPHYAGLQKLYSAHRAEGLEVLGFPANDFGAQEPGSDAEIAAFCSKSYAVTFPLFSKIAVKGAHQAPLYRYLTQRSPFPGEIRWNFEKWVVDRRGRVVARFHPRTRPDDPALWRAIANALRPPVAIKLPAAKSGPAAAALHAALARAAQERKEVFVHFSADWCGWCKRWAKFEARPEVRTILEQDFVLLALSTDHMSDGQALLDLFAGGKSTGIPFMVWLNPAGRITARSFDARGANIGCPYKAAEIEAFMNLFIPRAARASAEQLATLRKALIEQGEKSKEKKG